MREGRKEGTVTALALDIKVIVHELRSCGVDTQ